jgi:hypothetical protein
VSSQPRGLGCVIQVSGELTLVTEREFAALVAEALAAMSRAAESTARQSALYASEVMSRLAAYSELALNSRYRTRPKSADRGRLLELSGRALGLSRWYMRNAAGGAD